MAFPFASGAPCLHPVARLPVVRGVAPLVLCAVSAAGCADAGGSGGWAGETRDSAGVVVVENAGTPSWGEDEGWEVRRELIVGGDESRPETLFGHVADLAVDGEGSVYVLDQTAQEVRVFTRTGETRGTLAGPGEGPGELGPFTTSVLVRNDTVMVVDWGQARINRFDTGGTFLGSEAVPTGGAARSWWSATPDAFYFRSLQRFTDEDGRWRGRDALLRYQGGGVTDTVVVFRYAQTDLGSPDAPRVPLLVNAPAWTVLDDGRIAWIALEEGRLHLHGPDGTLRRLVSSASWVPRASTEADGELLEEKMGDKFEMLGASRELLEQLDVVPPGSLPAVTSVRAGPRGTLWVQRMGDPTDVDPMALNAPDPPTGFGGGVWDVLDEEGRYLGPVELPARTRVFRITEDGVYGVWRDDLDVEYVVRLGLVPRS